MLSSVLAVCILLCCLLLPIAYYRTFSSAYMSRNTKKAGTVDEEALAQFCSITGASVKDARRYLEKYKRADIAVDAFYNEASAAPSRARADAAPSGSKLAQLFDQYKDEDGENVTVDGTIQLCSDLGIDAEDVVLLALAYELKSPGPAEWTRKGWVDGWKALGCDSIANMKTALLRLRDRLGSDPQYFQKVYGYTFDFARAQGQRSLGIDTAQAFWNLLLPHGLQGGALAHTGDGEGWKPEYNQWWFDFLAEKGGKGVSKDTWAMFMEFVRTIDAKFEKYDPEAAWPSTIDDFVSYAQARLAAT